MATKRTNAEVDRDDRPANDVVVAELEALGRGMRKKIRVSFSDYDCSGAVASSTRRKSKKRANTGVTKYGRKTSNRPTAPVRKSVRTGKVAAPPVRPSPDPIPSANHVPPYNLRSRSGEISLNGPIANTNSRYYLRLPEERRSVKRYGVDYESTVVKPHARKPYGRPAAQKRKTDDVRVPSNTQKKGEGALTKKVPLPEMTREAPPRDRDDDRMEQDPEEMPDMEIIQECDTLPSENGQNAAKSAADIGRPNDGSRTIAESASPVRNLCRSPRRANTVGVDGRDANGDTIRRKAVPSPSTHNEPCSAHSLPKRKNNDVEQEAPAAKKVRETTTAVRPVEENPSDDKTDDSNAQVSATVMQSSVSTTASESSQTKDGQSSTHDKSSHPILRKDYVHVSGEMYMLHGTPHGFADTTTKVNQLVTAIAIAVSGIYSINDWSKTILDLILEQTKQEYNRKAAALQKEGSSYKFAVMNSTLVRVPSVASASVSVSDYQAFRGNIQCDTHICEAVRRLRSTKHTAALIRAYGEDLALIKYNEFVFVVDGNVRCNKHMRDTYGKPVVVFLGAESAASLLCHYIYKNFLNTGSGDSDFLYLPVDITVTTSEPEVPSNTQPDENAPASMAGATPSSNTDHTFGESLSQDDSTRVEQDLLESNAPNDEIIVLSSPSLPDIPEDDNPPVGP